MVWGPRTVFLRDISPYIDDRNNAFSIWTTVIIYFQKLSLIHI